MEHAAMSCPLPPGLSAEDQAVFERVWRRVMPEEGEDCPITVDGAPAPLIHGDLPCTCRCAPSARILPSQRDRPSPHRGTDFPDGGDSPCLGAASAVHGEQLQHQVMDALECWQTLRQLARRSAGPCGRILSAMAGEKLRSARRLAAAYFLISGVRWWPADRLTPPSLPSFQGTLRTFFHREQQRALAYEAAAADTGDGALADLYRELAGQSREHGEALRGILEQYGF